MSRRNISKKRFPKPDSTYNSYLVSLLTQRILKSGKKTVAENIVNGAFEIIKTKTNEDPLMVFEKAIKNASPVVEVKARRIGGSTYQVPIEVNAYRATNLSLRWIIEYSRQRVGRTMAIKLASEIIDTANDIGNTIKKKEETHRMAEANKAFALSNLGISNFSVSFALAYSAADFHESKPSPCPIRRGRCLATSYRYLIS